MYGLGDDIRAAYQQEGVLQDKLEKALREKAKAEKAYQELLKKYIKLLENRVGKV